MHFSIHLFLIAFKVKEQVFTPQLNHISMKMPTFSLMSQTEMIDDRQFCNVSTVKNCRVDYCQCPHVIQLRLKSVVELVLIDEGKKHIKKFKSNSVASRDRRRANIVRKKIFKETREFDKLDVVYPSFCERCLSNLKILQRSTHKSITRKNCTIFRCVSAFM